MADGTYKVAAAIEVGDELASVDVEEINSEDFDPSTWSSESFTILANAVTTVVSINTRSVEQLVSINGDLFSLTHWILTRKDGVVKFVNSADIDTTYQVWQKRTDDWVNVEVAEIIEFADTVYSIDCEPYNKIFTESALVYDQGPRPSSD